MHRAQLFLFLILLNCLIFMILKGFTEVNVWERTLSDSKLPDDKNFVHLKETTV